MIDGRPPGARLRRARSSGALRRSYRACRAQLRDLVGAVAERRAGSRRCAAPSAAAARRRRGRRRDRLKPARVTVIGRSTPGTSSNVLQQLALRAPAAAPAPRGTRQHAAGRDADLVERRFPFARRSRLRAPPRSPPSARRDCCLRASRSREARIVGQIGAADRRATSASNCSCLLAAMLSRPSPVLNVPDGAAVKLSLPIGRGSCAGDQIVRHHPAHGGERGVEHRHVDEARLRRCARAAPARRRWRRPRSCRRCVSATG